MKQLIEFIITILSGNTETIISENYTIISEHVVPGIYDVELHHDNYGKMLTFTCHYETKEYINFLYPADLSADKVIADLQKETFNKI